MAHGGIAAEDIELIMKLVYRSGLGNSTAIPPGPVAWVMQEDKVQRGDKPGIEMARDEYEAACFPTIQALLDKTGVPASQIKFVITNSSLFNPTPSLSAAVINRFGLKDDTINYNLGGMGCSGGRCAGGFLT
jgi:3-ketoacyl-CoA synthase